VGSFILWIGISWLCRDRLSRVRGGFVLICGLNTAGCVEVHCFEVHLGVLLFVDSILLAV
jgi:hypothetical protein